MRRFKHILLLFEDAIEPDTALARAAELAERNGAELTLLHCVEGIETADVGASSASAADAWRALQTSWEEQLEALAVPIRGRGVTVRTRALLGIPFREVISLVQREAYDLVVKAASAPQGPRGLLFGSTDMHLMRKCPCPVWVHKQRPAGRGYARVMAAIDIGDTDEVSQAMNRLILDLATSIGQLDESDVHVVHAWSSVGERMARTARRGLLPAAEIAREVEEEERRRHTLFEQAVTPYLQLPIRLHLHLAHGDPREVLPVFARDRQMDLLVMGTLARTGVSGFFMGNTAEDVLQQVDASVLTVKPEGFVSPVA